MNKPELLLPAGSIEKLEYALKYGADAIYLGTVDFSLRAMRKGELITYDNLKQAIQIVHNMGKKAYLTLNIFAYNEDIEALDEVLDFIKDANPDAIIVSDFGILNKIKKSLPNIDLHISTQTNILNYETVKFWRDLGASRVILARELSIPQIAKIVEKVPDIETEVFVHGSQCVSFSGRCLLSDYMTQGERKANHGGCAQPCRWSYKLLEETRPNEYYEIEQNEHGTHILSPKDLALIKYIPQLIDAGVSSFKVEGRTKSLYYVSAVAKTYRKAIDDYCKTGKLDEEFLFNELLKVGNRGYTTGFFIDKPNSDGYSYDISKGLAGADYLFYVMGFEANYYKVKIKNKVLVGDEIEVITPENIYNLKVLEIKSEKGEIVDVANTNDECFMKFSQNFDDYKYALARTIGIKNVR
ncbi:U32 family peptidase [bacterium]|nr:U32 family peptidase [bacterium]